MKEKTYRLSQARLMYREGDLTRVIYDRLVEEGFKMNNDGDVYDNGFVDEKDRHHFRGVTVTLESLSDLARLIHIVDYRVVVDSEDSILIYDDYIE